MMRGWLVAAVLLGAAWLFGNAAATSYTLADLAARPVVLVSGERPPARHPVHMPEQPGEVVPEGAARLAGGSGIPLGVRHRFALPDGRMVACAHVLRWMWCEGGWQAERGG